MEQVEGWAPYEEKAGDTVEEIESALEMQVGGDHYKKFPVQPVYFIAKNRLSFLQGCIIKRICRFNLPGGKGKLDLEKIKHEVNLIMELEDF